MLRDTAGVLRYRFTVRGRCQLDISYFLCIIRQIFESISIRIQEAKHIEKLTRIQEIYDKPVVVVFAGIHGTGKTTMAKGLEDDCQGLQLPYQLVAPGNVTRAIAKERGMDPQDRLQLHLISDPLVQAYGHDGYVDWLLGYMIARGQLDPCKEGIIIWDGARHIEGIRRLKEIFRKVYVVYCTSPVGSRLHSLCRREGEARARKLIELPSEIEFDPEMADIADYHIQYFTEIRPAQNDIVLAAREMMKD